MKGRGLQILLICSLVFNVFIIGGLSGAAIMWKRADVQRPLIGAGQPARLRQAAMNLSPQYRRELRRTLAETVRTLRPQAEQARAARREAAQLLTEPELDAAGLDAALRRARNTDIAIRTQIEASVVKFAATLPPEERIALGEALSPRNQRSKP